MAMGKRRQMRQHSPFVVAQYLPKTLSHPFHNGCGRPCHRPEEPADGRSGAFIVRPCRSYEPASTSRMAAVPFHPDTSLCLVRKRLRHNRRDK